MILLNDRNYKNSEFAEVRYTAGTRQFLRGGVESVCHTPCFVTREGA